EATRRAMTLKAAATKAEKAGKAELAKRKHVEADKAMRRALEISRSMLESYARVAQDRSDVGSIATIVEYVYRPLKAKLNSWTKE
ncbi:MAG: hypothetical protein U9N87_12715, partial [Planctomycetota bacterium]|nr:hypothetical protein [Planctomycetota bacterium]